LGEIGETGPVASGKKKKRMPPRREKTPGLSGGVGGADLDT